MYYCIGKKEKKYKVFRKEAKTLVEWKSKVQPEIKRRKFGKKGSRGLGSRVRVMETCDELSEICFFNNLHNSDEGVKTRPAIKFDATSPYDYGNNLGVINLHLCKEHLPKGLLGGDSDVKTLLIQRKAAKREVERFYREIKDLNKAKKTDVESTKKKYNDAKREENKIVSKAKEELDYYKNVLEESKKKKKELKTELKQLKYLDGFKKRLIENDIIVDDKSSSFGARRHRVEPPKKCEEVFKEYKNRIEDLIRNRNDIKYFIKNYIPTKNLYHVVALSCHPDKHVGGEEEKFKNIQQEVEKLKEKFLLEFDNYHEKIGQLQIIPSSADVTDIVEYTPYPEKEAGKPIEYHISPEILKRIKTPTPPPYDWKKVDLKPQGPYSPPKKRDNFNTPLITYSDVQWPSSGSGTDTTIVESPTVKPKKPALPARSRDKKNLLNSQQQSPIKRPKLSNTYDKKLFSKILPRVPGEPLFLYKYFFKSDTRERYEGIVEAILRYPKKERKIFAMSNPQMIMISKTNFDTAINNVNKNILLADSIIDVDNDNKNLADANYKEKYSAYKQWHQDVFKEVQKEELDFIDDDFKNKLNYIEQQKWCLKYVVGDFVGDKKNPVLRQMEQVGKSTYTSALSAKRKVLGETEPVSYYKEGLVRSAINLQKLLEEQFQYTGLQSEFISNQIQSFKSPQNNPTLCLTGEPVPDTGKPDPDTGYKIVLPEISYEKPDIDQRESDQIILQKNTELVEYNIEVEKCHTNFGYIKSIKCYGITDPISGKRLCYYVFNQFERDEKNQLNREVQTNVILNKETQLLADILFYRVIEQNGFFNVYMITDCVNSEGYKQLPGTNIIMNNLTGKCFTDTERNSLNGFLSMPLIFANMKLWMHYNPGCKRLITNLLQALHIFHKYNYVFEPLKHTQVYYNKTQYGNYVFRFQLENPVKRKVYQRKKTIEYMQQELEAGFLREYLLGENPELTETQWGEWDKFWMYMYCEANDLKHDYDKQCDPKVRRELKNELRKKFPKTANVL